MMIMNRKVAAVVLICLLTLVIIPTANSSSITVPNASKQISKDSEQALTFFWVAGHLKDVEIDEDDMYNGTVVNGVVIVWTPKFNIIPIPGFLMEGNNFGLKEFPELHTRILQLPNDHILFSMWYFGMVDYISENETAYFPLINFIN